MPYCRLFYHFTWTTKNRQPWITPQLTTVLEKSIPSKVVGLGGRLFAVNTYLDHIHTVVSIPPTLSVAVFIGQGKGVSSLRANQSKVISGSFQWQEEYCVFSLDESRLPVCISYVNRQKEHHSGLGGVQSDWEG
jgi:putative transposase